MNLIRWMRDLFAPEFVDCEFGDVHNPRDGRPWHWVDARNVAKCDGCRSYIRLRKDRGYL